MNRVPLLRRAELFSVTTINPHTILCADLVSVDAFPARMLDLNAIDNAPTRLSLGKMVSSRIVVLHSEIDQWVDEETPDCYFYLHRETQTSYIGPGCVVSEATVEQELGLHFNDPADAVKFALRWL